MFVFNDRLPGLPVFRPHPALLAGIIFVSIIVHAADQLLVSPDYEAMISDFILEENENLRQPEVSAGWREQPREPESRIKFGYDPAYEAFQAEKNEAFSNNKPGYETTTPNTLFRMEF